MRAEEPRFILVGRGDCPSEPKTMRIPSDCEPLAVKNGWYVIGREADILALLVFNPPRMQADGYSDSDPA